MATFGEKGDRYLKDKIDVFKKIAGRAPDLKEVNTLSKFKDDKDYAAQFISKFQVMSDGKEEKIKKLFSKVFHTEKMNESNEDTKNKEGLTLKEYKKKVRSTLDGMTLFGPKIKGFPNEGLWRTYGDEVTWDWNDDVPVKESVNKIVKAISAVNARI